MDIEKHMKIKELDDIQASIENLDKRITKSMPHRWMTATEAAIYLSVSRGHLYRKIKDQIPFVEVGSRIIFDRNDLDNYMEKNKT